MSEYGTCSTVNQSECVERITVVSMAHEIGKMLEEARLIMSDMGIVLFGDEPIEGNGPEPKCFAHEMDLNVAGMSSLLFGLRMLQERLYIKN